MEHTSTADRSFTSIEPYETLLRRLRPKSSIQLLRIFSNVPFSASGHQADHTGIEVSQSSHKIVGVFSSFGSEINESLNRVLPTLLEDSTIRVLLIGPGSLFIDQFNQIYPMFVDRISTSGRINVLQAWRHFESCDVLLQLYPDGASAARGTLLAAMASGVPVVTTEGPLTEPLLKASGALAIADSNPIAICGRIQHLLTDLIEARALGARGRRLYETHFHVQVAVRELRQGAPRASIAPYQAGGHTQPATVVRTSSPSLKTPEQPTLP